jgi:DNA-binding CsgD family transcriptional regulator
VRVLERAYDVEAAEPLWLRGVVDALRPGMEDRLGIAAYLYDASVRPLAVREPILDCPLDATGLAALMSQSNESYVRGAWLSKCVATASETPGYAEHPGVREVFHPLGIHDVLVLNVLDPTGIGCLVGAPLRRLRTLGDEERARWDRVAAHLRAALRLRLRLSTSRAESEAPASGDASGRVEAVLRRDGRIEHLTSPTEPARDALRDSVLRIERSRRALRARPDQALDNWRALVRGRWTLVDTFAEGDHRYVVARANAPSALGPDMLTPRERQVLSLLAMGHDYKLIAYELGVSHSTVRVLLARARAKLGAKTRAELVAKIRADY